MYWLLLPPSANPGRHIEYHSLPQSGSWGDLFRAGWAIVAHLFAPDRH
jgi:hypothetical protein